MRKIVFVVLSLFILIGCTHSLQVLNEGSFEHVEQNLGREVKLGFLPTHDRLLDEVIQEVSLNESVAKVKKNCSNKKNVDVDFMYELMRKEKRSASGQNFFITLPGFIIFTHSWLGYKYTIEIKTKSTVFDNQGEQLGEVIIKTPYEIRYTSFARGAASSLIGWIVPFGYVLDAIPGIIFSSYFDERALPDFYSRITPSYKSYVGSKLIEQIRTLQGRNVVHKEIEYATIELDENPGQKYNERHFGVEIYRVANGSLIPFENKVVTLSESILEDVNSIDASREKFDNQNFDEIISALVGSTVQGIKYAQVGIYTIKGERTLTLKHSSYDSPLFQKLLSRRIK